MSCFKREVDLYFDKYPAPESSGHRTGIPTLSNQQSVVTREQTHSPAVSDTSLDLPRGSVSSGDTVYSFEPPPQLDSYRSGSPTPALAQMEGSSSDKESKLHNSSLPLVQYVSPPPFPDAIMSAAIAFGASHQTAKVISTNVELYSLFDPLFEEVSSTNSTLQEISKDITQFTRQLLSISDGLRIIEGHPKETIKSNLSLQRLSPQHSIAYKDNNVRLWLHELISVKTWTDKGWQGLVSHERSVCNESVLKLMNILQGRLTKCEQIVLDIQERILKAREPLMKAGERHGGRFGEPWLKWAWDGVTRMKGFVARLDRFIQE